MKRVLFALLMLAACDKPTSDDCRKAELNMQRLRHVEDQDAANLEASVRRCRGGSSKDTVACVMAANTVEELDKCDAQMRGGGPKKTKPADKPTDKPADTPSDKSADKPAPGSGSAGSGQ